MTSKTYAFLIFLFFFHCLIAALGFFCPLLNHAHSHTLTVNYSVISTVIRREEVLRCLDKIWGRRRSETPPTRLSLPCVFSFFYSLLEGAEKEEGGAGSIKLDLMSEGAAAFFVNTRQIKSADEAIVVSGNCFYTQLKECLVGGTGRLPPEIY